MRSLSGRTAIVTGAAGGMGGGITTRLVEEGVNVVCFDRVDPSVRVKELNEIRADAASGFQGDVRDAAAITECIDSVVKKYGRLDIMINNAGVEQPLHQVVDTPDEVFREVMDVDFYGVFVGIRAAGKVMQAQGGGAIINTASQLGKVAFETWGVYSAAKAAVISITQAAARELARNGVRVNAVCPGTFNTPLAWRAFSTYAERAGVTTQEMFDGYGRDAIGLGRLGEPAEMGALCAFLASDDASFITGAAINLTGGEQYFF
jgi:NAD(P)-dependent dehydrogenase (short-subunit alcohol dehydrogenase family)